MANRYVEPAPGDQITRDGFAVIPSRMLHACVNHKDYVYVYAYVAECADDSDPVMPTEEELAAQCGTTVERVRAAMKWLMANRWIVNIAGPGEDPSYYVNCL